VIKLAYDPEHSHPRRSRRRFGTVFIFLGGNSAEHITGCWLGSIGSHILLPPVIILLAEFVLLYLIRRGGVLQRNPRHRRGGVGGTVTMRACGFFIRIIFGVVAGACLYAPARRRFARRWLMDRGASLGDACRGVSADAGMVDVGVQDARGGWRLCAACREMRVWCGFVCRWKRPSGLAGAQGGEWSVDVVLRSVDGGEGGGGNSGRDRVALVLGTGGGDARGRCGGLESCGDGVGVRVSEEGFCRHPAGVCRVRPGFSDAAVQARIDAGAGAGIACRGCAAGGASGGWGGPPSGNCRNWCGTTDVLPGAALWTTAVGPVRRPALVEPGLGRFAEVPRPMVVSEGVTAAVLLTGPLAVVLLVINRGCFAAAVWCWRCRHSPWPRDLRCRRLSAGQWLAAGTCGPMAAGEASIRRRWGGDAGRRLACCAALFGTPVAIAAESGRQLFPVAATMDEYWALRHLQLSLNGGMRLAGYFRQNGATI